ncbi:MAG: PASTA domain-containing protein [Candidatus Azobacteroides sp.]|nr:PASTA domain-containing protein [Candidatus Azobacteroides sp.]
MKIWSFIKDNIYARNILLAVLIVFLIMFCLKWWLNVYTHHGEAVIVPDVRGLKIEQAVSFFEKNNLRFEVVDSVYNKTSAPGTIVETIPAAGTKVKKNRNIYVTINAYSAQTGITPEFKDQSLRQAIANLNAVGFKNVQIKYVPGAYRDLVIGLGYRGREVNPGERLRLDSQFVLLVSDGAQSTDELNEDSINHPETTDSSVDDSWFH